jgi:hypothetical protein
MRVLHWKWIAVSVIQKFVTILWVSVYHKIGDHTVVLEGVSGGDNATITATDTTTTTTTTTTSSSSSSSR